MFLESAICKTRVGPSVVILTEIKPEPGLNLFRLMACSTGIPLEVRSCMMDNDGPNTTSFPKKEEIEMDHNGKKTYIICNTLFELPLYHLSINAAKNMKTRVQ